MHVSEVRDSVRMRRRMRKRRWGGYVLKLQTPPLRFWIAVDKRPGWTFSTIPNISEKEIVTGSNCETFQLFMKISCA